jgi:hypothetical protein
VHRPSFIFPRCCLSKVSTAVAGSHPKYLFHRSALLHSFFLYAAASSSVHSLFSTHSFSSTYSLIFSTHSFSVQGVGGSSRLGVAAVQQPRCVAAAAPAWCSGRDSDDLHARHRLATMDSLDVHGRGAGTAMTTPSTVAPHGGAPP